MTSKDIAHDVIGWNFRPCLMRGVEEEAAVNEACSVVQPVRFSFFQAHTGAYFVLGPMLFAVVERAGGLHRNRYATYPESMEALVRDLVGVQCLFVDPQAP